MCPVPARCGPEEGLTRCLRSLVGGQPRALWRELVAQFSLRSWGRGSVGGTDGACGKDRMTLHPVPMPPVPAHQASPPQQFYCPGGDNALRRGSLFWRGMHRPPPPSSASGPRPWPHCTSGLMDPERANLGSPGAVTDSPGGPYIGRDRGERGASLDRGKENIWVGQDGKQQEMVDICPYGDPPTGVGDSGND